MYVFFFFFFSSRRRHTRCSRDWSSDVCSSDLMLRRLAGRKHQVMTAVAVAQDGRVEHALDVTDVTFRRLTDEQRSEEHTSELQSRLHLVCRLLLEKKKKNAKTRTSSKTTAMTQ